MTQLHAPDLRVVPSGAVRAVLEADRPGCAEVVRRTYRLHADGATVNPFSSFLRFPEAPTDRIIALPASVRGDDPATGIKWIASWPGNPGRGLPRASAVLLLNDERTGYPYAVLESSLISASRTAASAVVAAEELIGTRSAPAVSVVGAGQIARHVLAFLRDLGWEVGEVVLHDRDPGRTAATARWLATAWPAVRVRRAADCEDAVRSGGLVVFATVASRPHVEDPSWFDHRPVVLHLSLRDLAADVLLAAANVTDDVGHALREGTSMELARRADPGFTVDATIGDLLCGRATVDRSATRIFAPFGLGCLDMAVGQWVERHQPPAAVVEGFYDEVEV